MNKEHVVIEILNISKSLQTQCSELKEYKNDIHKVLTKVHGKNQILYLLEGCEFGPNSIISVTSTMTYPVLYKTDYNIVKDVDYNINTKLLERLKEKNRQREII